MHRPHLQDIYLLIYLLTVGLIIGFMAIIRYSMYCKYFYDKVMARPPMNPHVWTQLSGNYRQEDGKFSITV